MPPRDCVCVCVCLSSLWDSTVAIFFFFLSVRGTLAVACSFCLWPSLEVILKEKLPDSAGFLGLKEALLSNIYASLLSFLCSSLFLLSVIRRVGANKATAFLT